MFPKVDPSKISEPPILADILQQSALVLVDLQNDYLHADGLIQRRGYGSWTEEQRSSFVTATDSILAAMRVKKRPIVWLRTALRPDYLDSGFGPGMARLELGKDSGFLVEGSWGARFIDEFSPLEGEHIVTTKGHSPFQFTHLDRLLANLGVSTLLIVGGGVYDGVPETVRQAGMLGYEVVVPRECVAYGHMRGREPSPSQATVVPAAEVVSTVLQATRPRASESPGYALILVDIQNDFLHRDGFKGRQSGRSMAGDDWESFMGNNLRLIEAAHKAGAPVIFVGTHARKDNLDRAWSKSMRRSSPIPEGEFYLPMGSWGAEFVKPLDPQPEDFVVMKRGQSGFGLTHLHRILRNHGVTQCYIAGGAVHGCVEHTIRDGVGLGYAFTLVHDAAYPVRSLNEPVLASHARYSTTDEAVQEIEARA
jgi:nicotinamidase-related amidase